MNLFIIDLIKLILKRPAFGVMSDMNGTSKMIDCCNRFLSNSAVSNLDRNKIFNLDFIAFLDRSLFCLLKPNQMNKQISTTAFQVHPFVHIMLHMLMKRLRAMFTMDIC